MVKLMSMGYLKVKGSTLVEILIASIIILVSFSVAIRTISEVPGRGKVLDKIDTNSCINHAFMGETEIDTFLHGGWILVPEKEKASLGLADQVYRCKIEQEKRLVYLRHQLIKAQE